MALNKVYWDYDNANSDDWSGYGIKYADKQIYANPNFSWGNLDLSFPTSFRKSKVTKIYTVTSSTAQDAVTVDDCIIYNSMVRFSGSGNYGSFYKDNILSYYSAGNEGYYPVIDIDTHEFAYKMTVRLFTSGNWVTVNAVDFVNNYDNYDAGVYGYINNYMTAGGGRTYGFCNFYDCGNSQFSVKANWNGFRTSGYSSKELGGHVTSGQTWIANRTIWQLATTSGMANYSAQPATYNMYIPFEIPELQGQSWNAGNYQTAPAALITGGIYTNHAVLSYSDQRVYMPLKHILKDIIVNCGLVLLDSTDTKWISMVDDNGLCQGKLVLLSSDEAKESSIYNTRTSDNNLNPSPPEPPSPGDDEVDMPLYAASYGAGLTHYYVFTKDSQVLEKISDAMSTWDLQNTGKDLFRNLISCKLVRVGAVPAENSTFVIYGEELQYQGDAITIQVVTGNPTLDLGEYTIDRFYNDFRDYAPFTKVEMFVPFCGWVPLPSHVMGNKISGTLIIDIISATCKAVIKCGKTVVAEAAGVCGLDVPFVAENVGMKMAAIASSMTSYGKAASGAVGTVAAGVAGTAVGGAAGGAIAGIAASGKLIEAAGAAAQLYASVNANYTEICGKTGDGCNIGGLDAVYIKVQRPNYKKLGFSAPLYVPDGFAHSAGFIAMKYKKVSECTGYIECGNVDTSGISGATERERSIIKAYLESGVIVNHVEP